MKFNCASWGVNQGFHLNCKWKNSYSSLINFTYNRVCYENIADSISAPQVQKHHHNVLSHQYPTSAETSS